MYRLNCFIGEQFVVVTRATFYADRFREARRFLGSESSNAGNVDIAKPPYPLGMDLPHESGAYDRGFESTHGVLSEFPF